MIFDAMLPFGPTPEDRERWRRERREREMEDIDVDQSNEGFFCIVLMAVLTLVALMFVGASLV